MKIFSLTQDNFELRAFEIEVSLMPGLPQISILGQADALVKESIPKIQSAIKFQGFQLPKAKHILVDLKPQYLKKNNRGLELAIATAILLETKQIKLSSHSKKPWLIVGNLSLKGEVVKTRDSISQFADLKKFEILAGPDSQIRSAHSEIESLKDLKCPRWIEASPNRIESKIKAKLPQLNFSKNASRLIQILATGEHPCLIAGAMGSGKSTIVSMIPKMIDVASEADLEEIQKIQKYFNQEISSRPEVNVHHSISTIAFLGGGAKLHPGEITRAHKGTLVMDEFMQFDSVIQDALREPLENAKLTVARNGEFVEFPADVFLLATTNLCKCGQFAMSSNRNCICYKTKLRSYLAKMVGPCLDRFQVLAFSSSWEGQIKELSSESIYEQVQRGVGFRKLERGQVEPNSKMTIEQLSFSMDQTFVDEYFKLDFMSERRQLSLKRVARTIADLDASARVRIKHFNEALGLTVATFQWLEQAQKASAQV